MRDYKISQNKKKKEDPIKCLIPIPEALFSYLRRIYRDIIRVIEHVQREQSSRTLANL